MFEVGLGRVVALLAQKMRTAPFALAILGASR